MRSQGSGTVSTSSKITGRRARRDRETPLLTRGLHQIVQGSLTQCQE